MSRDKCKICSSEISEGFMGKIVGTVVRVKVGESTKLYFVCSSCQKEHGDRLKEKLEG